MRKSILNFSFFIINFSLFLASCTSDSYETGDGEYSYTTAEMVTFPLAEQTTVNGELDDNRILTLAQPLNTDGLRTNFDVGIHEDMVRMMILFNKTSESSSTICGEYVGARLVYMSKIHLSDTITHEIKTDPLTLKSSWAAKNSKYLNLHFAVKTGLTESGQKAQNIAIVCDSIKTTNTQEGVQDEETTVFLRFVHNQNGVPEFYSSEAYLSISRQQLQKLIKENLPTGQGKPMRINLDVNTYDGLQRLTFSLTPNPSYW